MTKRATVIGLALMATLVCSAMMASAAAAAKYVSTVSPVYITASNTTDPEATTEASQTHIFTVSGGTIKCKMVSATGKVTGTASGTKFAASALKENPTYTECTAFGQTATVTMNGCEFEYQEPTASGGSFVSGAKVVCPAGKAIVVKTTTGTTCSVEVGSQTTTGNVTWTNKTETTESTTREVLTFNTNVTGIKYSSSGGICGSSGTGGTGTGIVTATGYSSETTHNASTWVNLTIE